MLAFSQVVGTARSSDAKKHPIIVVTWWGNGQQRFEKLHADVSMQPERDESLLR